MNHSKLYLFFLASSFSLSVLAGQTTALYEPASLVVGPFPSNVTTVADPAQSTGLRVNLPSSNDACDPSVSPSVCSNSTLLNQLDGFSVNPRLMVCFSAAVDPATLHDGIHIISVGNGSLVAINQIVFDPASNCAFAKPNQVLSQQSEYLLTVTDSVHDAGGKKVKQDDRFKDCLRSSDAYCQALNNALNKVVQQPASANKVIAASLFTTMSATAWLEKARRFVDLTELPIVLPAGIPFSFKLSNLQKITWVPAQSGLPPQDIPLSALSAVDRIAFGLYLSPNFINPADGTIPVTPTNAAISGALPLPGIPLGLIPVSFHIFFPPGPTPAGGFPTVIYGHGLGDNQFGAPTFIASTLAQKGFATLAIEITGHGYGAASVVKLTGSLGTHTVATPGRGILIPGKTQIGSTDGCIALPPAVAVRDCGRQTAIDLVALVAAIRKTAGLGMQINPNRLYYVGQSFGGTYGTLFHAIEPDVKTAVLNGAGGTSVDVARLGITGRALSVGYLASVNPALLNVPPAPPERYFHDVFNDNYVFRDTAPVINNVPGAMAIQAAFEAADWLGMLGDPLSYAPHLKQSPLADVPAKSTVFQFGLADLEVPNPTESAVIRAAGAQSSSWFLRFDKAAAIAPDLVGVTDPSTGLPLPILPHRVLSNPTIFSHPTETPLALAEQLQVGDYFASNGTTNPDPNQFLTGPFAGQSLFEIPAVLPEQLNYFQLQP
ncbi:MAG TPA: Ig-like domain-containing protein [Bryobacteraceae bacterium]